MSKHKWGGNKHGGGHGRSDGYAPSVANDAYAGRPTLNIPTPILWVGAIVGLAVWSLVAWVGYISVDGILDWLSSNAGSAVEGGKSLATAAGVPAAATNVVDSLKLGSGADQVIALLRVILKPAIVLLWGLGSLVLLAAPVIVPRLGPLLGTRRH